MIEAADNFFYRLGYWVATHAKLTLLICLVFVAVCCSGFVNFEYLDGKWYSRPLVPSTYFPQNSEAENCSMF